MLATWIDLGKGVRDCVTWFRKSWVKFITATWLDLRKGVRDCVTWFQKKLGKIDDCNLD